MTPLNSLVTGGAQGIGRAIVSKLQNRGDRVFVFDIIDLTDTCVLELSKQGIYYIQVDVSSVDSIKDGFSAVYKILDISDDTNQSSHLDILINNAGVTKDNLVLRMSELDWDYVLDVNLKGTFFCIQQALRRMVRQKKSYIINMGSIVGESGNPGQANYAASKAGVVALTKTLAQEYASRNVLVNAIAPGFIQTPMTDKLPEKIKQYALDRISLKRFGTVSDVADLVLFLSSGQADYITGQIIDLNGGIF